MSARHLISKQRFDLRLTRHEEAWEIQGEVSRLCSQRLAPAFENLFDRLAAPDHLIRLGKIELDAGVISKHDLFSQAFARMLIGLLEEAIVEATDCSPSGAVSQPLQIGRFELWLYFLENGYLPAHAAVPASSSEWHRQVLETLTADGLAVQRLCQLLASRPPALERLVAQFEQSFLQQIVALLTGQKHDRLADALREVGAVISQCLQSQAALTLWLTQPDVWQRIFREAGLPTNVEAVSARIAKLLHEASALQALSPHAASRLEAPPSTTMLRQIEVRLWRILLDEAIGQGRQANSAQLMARAFQHQSLRTLQHVILKAVAPNHSSWRRMSEEIRAFAESPPNPVKTKVNPQRHEHANERQTPSVEEDIFYIPNAGVILLHPFLPRFFSNLDLREGSSFKDEWSRGIAVCLVHYLASGELGTPEYQLVLPKLLCGMLLNAPLDHTILIDAEAQEEGQRLLRSAIEQWGEASKRKPEWMKTGALREGFLQRAGKLERRQTGWFLQLERNTLDILLDRLPWNLSIVKLPWMEEMLRVEWR